MILSQPNLTYGYDIMLIDGIECLQVIYKTFEKLLNEILNSTTLLYCSIIK